MESVVGPSKIIEAADTEPLSSFKPKVEGVRRILEPQTSGKWPHCIIETINEQFFKADKPIVAAIRFMDGTRTIEQAASEVERTTLVPTSPRDIAELIDRHLRPQGLMDNRKMHPEGNRSLRVIARLPVGPAMERLGSSMRVLYSVPCAVAAVAFSVGIWVRLSRTS